MTAPNIRTTSVFGVEKEVTEGTFVAPSGTGSYVQPLEDGFEFTPQRELIERTVLTSSIGAATPRKGTKSASGSLSVELRASGTEGGAPDFEALLESALGAVRSIGSTTTTKSSGNTGSSLKIEDADISKFNVGDIVLVKQTSGHHVSPITSVTTTPGSAAIGLLVPKSSGSFSNSVVVSKAKTYYTASTGHPALSLAYYWSNEIRQAASGAKISSFAIDGFTTGQLAKFVFGWDALSYTEIDGAAPHTPAYDSALPPVILNACAFKDGTEITINNFSLSLQNTLGFQTSSCSSNGRVASRVTDRQISGTINPYMDDTTTDWFTLFDVGTEFSLFVRAYNPSSTSGEIDMGSVVGIYLPKCIVTEFSHGDLEGLVTDEVSFQAVRGVTGSTEELYLGFI